MNWNQLLTILWLKWRLSRNQWSRGGQLNMVVTMIVVVVGFAIGIGGGIGGVLAGVLVLSGRSPMVILVVWDVIIGIFLFFWMIGIVSEIQRSETIDISRMLHLPISLRDIFVVNYLASHLSLSIILFLPGMLGLSLGLIFGRSWSMIWLFPLVLGFIFMITAWTYCLRGWLATLMLNKRRRRAIIAAITFAFILLSQLPNIYLNVVNNHKRHRRTTTETNQSEQQTTTGPRSADKSNVGNMVLAAHNYVPFLWTGNGARSLAMGNVWPAVLGSAGMFLIGGLGLRRAYRTTFRFYQGQTTSTNTSRRPKVKKSIAVGRNPLERQLPFVPEEVAALSLAFFRSLLRAPEVKMALGTNIIMLIIFGSMVFLRRSSTLGDNFKPFIATGTIALTFFGMGQLMFNQFGFDRGGFRKLVLLPVPRKYILLGKNLAILPIAFGIGLSLLVLVKFLLGIPLVVIIAASFQLVAAFLLLSMVGNLLSVLVPYRIAPGSLKPTKVPAMTTLLIIVSHMLFPITMIPIFLPPVLGVLWSSVGWLGASSANFLFSAVLLVMLVFFYRLSLPSLGKLLQRREKEILNVVTREVE
jgi:ABC-2 type transport system permease protein